MCKIHCADAGANLIIVSYCCSSLQKETLALVEGATWRSNVEQSAYMYDLAAHYKAGKAQLLPILRSLFGNKETCDNNEDCYD